MDSTQRGVAIGMAAAVATTIAGLIVGAMFIPIHLAQYATESRMSLAAMAVLAPALSLLICIARLAKHRFFTPADINGSGLTSGTDRAKLLQALLQNTLEQSALAVPVYIAFAMAVPEAYLGAIVTAPAMFLVGRICFFVGYASGAPSRAFGFALTFYPTAILTISAIFFFLKPSIG
jgi:uncharacterized membrane protein YecN with MAPEG domain